MSENKKHPNAEFIIAFADGKKLQFRQGLRKGWIDFQGEKDETPEIGPWNAHSSVQWRIKPEQKWVRVALLGYRGDEWASACFNEGDEKDTEKSSTFSHWLSDRLYYTPKERP